MEPEDIQRLGDAFEPLSGRDLVALFDDDEAREQFRETLKRLASEDFESEMVGAPDGFRNTYKGVDGLIEGWRDFAGVFSHFVNTITEVVPVGEKVVVLVKAKGQTTTGDVEIENDGAGVFTFDDGKLTRAEFHLDRKEAMRSAGVEPG